MIIDIAILCPVEVEFNIIRKILSCPKSVHFKHLAIEVGQLKGQNFEWNVAVIEPDHNITSFTLKTKEVISILQPNYIILAGVAGGIKDPQLGDIVIGTKSYLYEGGKETIQGFVSRPRVVENSFNELLTIAKRVARDFQLEEVTFHFGAIASGNKVLANIDSQTVENIKTYYSDSQAVEMEAYEFALTASRSGIPYINIRGISDLIENKSKSDAEGFQIIACERVALFVQQLILHLPHRETPVLFNKKVHVLYQKNQLFLLRNITPAMLRVKNDVIEIDSSNKKEIIRNVLEVEHTKLDGELRKSWVRVKYSLNMVEKEIYLSSSSPIGKGFWFGGSQDLLLHFQKQLKKQIQL